MIALSPLPPHINSDKEDYVKGLKIVETDGQKIKKGKQVGEKRGEGSSDKKGLWDAICAYERFIFYTEKFLTFFDGEFESFDGGALHWTLRNCHFR